MAYPRGGHSGAVAVSYSTNSMSPLSPPRRYSGSTGSGTSVTSGTNSSSTARYSNYRSTTPSNLGNDRNTGYYSSASNAGYRGYTSSETFKRGYYSPVRSVSYNESSSSVGASSTSRYGSVSSASSSTGSSSSSASRDRGVSYTSKSLATTAADLYAIYSPSNYVPNIHGAKSSNSNGWRSSSSGISSSLISELHGGDEYDSCRDRRERSYSSETSSGIGLSSGSSNNQNSTSNNWTSRREVGKRRTTPTSVRNSLTSGNANKTDSGSSTIEVTLDPEDSSRKDQRETSSDVGRDSVKSEETSGEARLGAINGDGIDLDNNNELRNDRSLLDECNLDTRRRRRRQNGEQLQSELNGRRDEDEGQKNLTRRENDGYVRERSKGETRENHNDHHQRKRHSEREWTNEANNRKNETKLPEASYADRSHSDDSNVSSVAPSSKNSEVKNLGSNENGDTGPVISTCARLRSVEEPGKLNSSQANCDESVGGGGLGGVVVDSSADADNHRKALTRTKIPTNNDNTELLTNNNVQDREDHLGIVEASRKIGNEGKIAQLGDANDAGQMVRTTSKSTSWTDEDGDLGDKALTNGDEPVNGFDSNEDISRVYEESGTLLRNGVRSTGSRSDDVEKGPSRRIIYAWNDSTIDDLSGASSSSSTAASSSSSSPSSSGATSSNVVPAGVHQNPYRGLNDQLDESSNSRTPRGRAQSRRDGRYGLNGLRNIGNTCFMNSVIQCLSNTRPLLEYLLNEQHLQDINTTTSSMKGALIKAFGQVIQELWEPSGDHIVNTTALKSQIQRFAPRFMGFSQQDAQEFLRYLLEGLHEDVNRVTVKPQPILTDIPDHYSDSLKAAESWKRYLRTEDSTIVDVFVGQLRSSLLCTACDHVSVTLDPFWDLSLPIPMRLGTVKLNQCLEHFTKAETLDGDEKPTCSKCQMRRKCTKSFSIQKFPKILVIHLKRFSPTERFRGKLSVLVDFPLNGLDLSAFAAPGVQGCTYNLYGVANHSGTTYSGHYTAYCKHPYSGEWHEYNDSRVSTVPARSVVSSEAYVLFYEQQPPSPHL